MAETITVNTLVTLSSGPRFATNRSISAEALEKVEVTLASGANDVEVDLQPSAADKVQFMQILSDWYGDDLTYKIGAAGAAAVALDQPHLFVGKGAVAMLGANLTKVFLSNASAGANARDAQVRVLIGRDATP